MRDPSPIGTVIRSLFTDDGKLRNPYGENPTDLERGIEEGLGHDGPALPDLVTLKQLVMPPKIQLDKAEGFSLCMLKAIVKGAAAG